MAYLRKYTLPSPEKKGRKFVWHPVIRLSPSIPWGYIVDPEDDGILLPVPEQLELLEEAKLMKKRYSYRELSNWLTSMTGRPISHVGLMNRFKDERRRKNKARFQRQIASDLEKALEKAKKLEARVGGAGTREAVDPGET